MEIIIKVLGEFDNVSTRIVVTSGDKTEWRRQLRQAVASLEAELEGLDKCPYHREAKL